MERIEATVRITSVGTTKNESEEFQDSETL